MSGYAPHMAYQSPVASRADRDGTPQWRAGRTPSGLFPSVRPPRALHPTYREPHPVRVGSVTAGVIAALVWMVLFGLLGPDLAGYVWWTLAAGLLAWAAALLLTRHGDRGIAAGIALVTAIAWSTAWVATTTRWATSGDWPLW